MVVYARARVCVCVCVRVCACVCVCVCARTFCVGLAEVTDDQYPDHDWSLDDQVRLTNRNAPSECVVVDPTDTRRVSIGCEDET